MDIQFRKLTRPDLDTVMRIESASRTHGWTRKVFWRGMNDPMTRGVVLQVDGETRGYTVCMSEGLACHLLNIAIDPEWRRQGLGTAAIRDIEDFARKKNLIEVCFEVEESNLPAQMLYKRLGYEAVEILRAHYGDDDGYLMRKAIHLEDQV